MSAIPILKRALLYGAILTAALAIVGSIVGFLVAGVPGLVSALIGALMTVVFFGLTAATILLATRVSKGQIISTGFFAIVLGGWLVKLLIFLGIVVILGRTSFIDPMVFFVSIVVAVIGSLVVDVLAFVRARVPYVSDVSLPGDANDPRI
ncbi:hypothetical protein [Compostimonas suwonensis]|uniref:ATP synthase protein I n=1 Tax=Compostimonas suwonensis TaxID=1048394 RepID=A0A2M9BUG9_9MICO|nr:hypothetical protein [Compostimonas suwonensis]PJJ61589.1 hypothetical protein CLV54_2535 [Compostimonas suwonensis]